MSAHEATLRLAFATPEQAARMAASVAPENEGYVRVRVEGAALVVEAAAATPMGLLRTLDDLVACLAAAQKAERLGTG